MKFLIEARVVQEHPEGMLTLEIDSGFGSPHVQFHPGKILKIEEVPESAKGDTFTFKRKCSEMLDRNTRCSADSVVGGPLCAGHAPDQRKPCTCIGTCEGAAGLGEGWRCVMMATR